MTGISEISHSPAAAGDGSAAAAPRIVDPPGWGERLVPAGPEALPQAAARILVVDDEAIVRMLVVDLLREHGHAVQEAEDGHAALSKLRSSDVFDLMITDIALPKGLDGSTLARQARRLHPVLPILFITGYAFDVEGGIKLEPGIPVLTKPFTLGALSARVSRLLAA